MAITLSADERISLNLGPGLFSFELGPFVGFNGGYLVQEAISGITSTTWLCRHSPTRFRGRQPGLRLCFASVPAAFAWAFAAI